MEDLSECTPTQLLKMINDSKVEHENLKKEIVNLTYEVDTLESKINAKIAELTIAEQRYVELIEELNNRKNAIR
jgi:Spy/CpxP family protein refolding chaperone